MSLETRKESNNFEHVNKHQPTEIIISTIGEHVTHVRPHNPESKVVGVVKKNDNEQFYPPDIDDCRDVIFLDTNRQVRDTTYLSISDDLEYLTVGKEESEEQWSITKVTFNEMYGAREYLVAIGTEQEVIDKAFVFSRIDTSKLKG